MTIRVLSRRDVPLLRKLFEDHRHAFDPFWDDQAIEAELREAGKCLSAVRKLLGATHALVMEDDGRFLGYVRFGETSFLYDKMINGGRLVPVRLHGYIFIALVNQHHRAKGIGFQLVEGALQAMKARRYPVIYYTHSKVNDALWRLSEKLGFEKVCEYPSFSRTGERITILQRLTCAYPGDTLVKKLFFSTARGLRFAIESVKSRIARR